MYAPRKIQRCLVIKADGKTKRVKDTLKDKQDAVGGYVNVVTAPESERLGRMYDVWCLEDALLRDEPANGYASILAARLGFQLATALLGDVVISAVEGMDGPMRRSTFEREMDAMERCVRGMDAAAQSGRLGETMDLVVEELKSMVLPVDE